MVGQASSFMERNQSEDFKKTSEKSEVFLYPNVLIYKKAR